MPVDGGVNRLHSCPNCECEILANAYRYGVTEFRHVEVSAREFPSSAEEGWPRHQKKRRSHFDGADGVVVVKKDA